MEYELRFDHQGHILNDCQARSYTEGERAGLRAVARDLKALAAQAV